MMPMTFNRVPGSLAASSMFVLLAATGCAPTADRYSGLNSVIKDYYAAHATEENGACRSPKIDTIQERKRVETAVNGNAVMMVRYSYFDRHADMDANWDKLVHLSQPCGGMAERRFVIAESDVGYRVTQMDGERQGEESTD